MLSDTTSSGEVLRAENHLALDGYHIDREGDLARITLMVGQQCYEHTAIELDAECPTRDEAILEAMVGYLNCGGHPDRLARLAVGLSRLPHIEATPYKVIGAFGHVEWVSYQQHRDSGKLFEVRHGIMSEEVTEDTWRSLEEDYDQETDQRPRTQEAEGACPQAEGEG